MVLQSACMMWKQKIITVKLVAGLWFSGAFQDALRLHPLLKDVTSMLQSNSVKITLILPSTLRRAMKAKPKWMKHYCIRQEQPAVIPFQTFTVLFCVRLLIKLLTRTIRELFYILYKQVELHLQI